MVPRSPFPYDMARMCVLLSFSSRSCHGLFRGGHHRERDFRAVFRGLRSFGEADPNTPPSISNCPEEVFGDSFCCLPSASILFRRSKDEPIGEDCLRDAMLCPKLESYKIYKYLQE